MLARRNAILYKKEEMLESVSGKNAAFCMQKLDGVALLTTEPSPTSSTTSSNKQAPAELEEDDTPKSLIEVVFSFCLLPFAFWLFFF